MGKLIMITGGARCGKSFFAEEIAKGFGDSVLYIATLVPNDDDTRYRIARHKSLRPESWDTLEAYQGIDQYIDDFGAEYDAIILDSVSAMITNLMSEYEINWENADQDIVLKVEKDIRSSMKNLVEEAKIVPAPIILVTSELGMGTVPEDRLTRVYRDVAGRVNTFISSQADEVYFVVSGLRLKIKQ